MGKSGGGDRPAWRQSIVPWTRSTMERFPRSSLVVFAFLSVASFHAVLWIMICVRGLFMCQCSQSSINIVNRSFQGDLCAPVIDVVYTWVNGSDPLLIEQIARFRAEDGELAQTIADHSNSNNAASANPTDPVDQTKHGQNRFRDNEELRYSLRSLWMYAPWVRNVYIVTNGQVPYWLDTSHPNLHIVTHQQIFPNRSHLPVFSSPAIEVHLHRIPNLSDHFIYFNDDTMLGNDIWPEDFWSRQHGPKVYLSWDVPQCSSGCPDSWLNDNYCDPVCNTTSCNYDEGDCLGPNVNERGAKSWKGRVSPAVRMGNSPTIAHESQSYCETGCPNSWLGDKVCDRACKTARCGFDAGDCGTGLVRESVYRYVLDGDGMNIVIPSDRMSAYIDMSAQITTLITSAEHECEQFVRSAIIIQSEKLLILVLLPALDRPCSCTVAISIKGEDVTSPDRTISFTIRRDTTPAPGPSPLSPSPNPSPNIIQSPTVISNENPISDQEQDPLQKQDRALLGVRFHQFERGDFDTILRGTAVEGVPSNRYPDGVALMHQMNENEWSLAEAIVKAKREHLLELDQIRLESVVRDYIQEHERVRGVVWPWDLTPSHRPQAPTPNFARHKLDAFGDSLRFVTRLYNAYFSVQSRKVPAHMPHMIDKRVMSEIQSIWAKEFDATSSHRFRSSLDVQFAFSFFYYMMEAPELFSSSALFRDEIDLDRDGYVSEMELRHFTNINKQISFSEMTNALINCSLAIASARGHIASSSEGVSVTEETLNSCPPVLAMLKPMVETRKRFKHQKASMDQVTFYMVGDNATVVHHRLEEILVERKKFVCLNDDMHNPELGVSIALSEFFESYYPHRSPFELPKGAVNRYVYIDDLLAWHRMVAVIWFMVEAALVALLTYAIIRRESIKNYIRRNRGKVKIDKQLVAF